MEKSRNKRKKRRIIVTIILLFFIFLWLNNTSLFTPRKDMPYKFLAHRGLAQVFDESKANWDSNTAEMIDTNHHLYCQDCYFSKLFVFKIINNLAVIKLRGFLIGF